jgi:carbon-monoxide dehydrogenase medium subunit
MKPASFEYHRTQDCAEALALLRELGDDARVLAGGQSLLPLMNFRLAQPAHLVAIGGIEELRYVRAEGDELVVGAASRQADVEHDHLVREHLPLLSDALQLVAHPPIRHRGTVCGSLAHADPAAELPAVALALEATLVARSADGARHISANQFFDGAFTTTLEPGELLAEVRFPVVPRTRHGILEFARTHGNFAVAGAVVVLRTDEGPLIKNASIVVFGACPRPTRVDEAAALLDGEEPRPELMAEVAARAAESVETFSDLHGSASYRRRLARVYVERALRAAVGRAQEVTG